jgi:hypothetical protein
MRMLLKDYMDRKRTKKAKRKANVRFLRSVDQKEKPVALLYDRTELKEAIVTLLGLLDKRINGPYCRLDKDCPAYPKFGVHYGACAYHLVEQQRGDSARFLPENVVWACSDANYGEMRNRSLYRDKHDAIFGRERMERIRAISRTKSDFSRADLLEIRNAVKAGILSGTFFWPTSVKKPSNEVNRFVIGDNR